MKDELSPISGGYRNAFGGWAATLVDTLDTLHIMEMAEEFGIALTAIKDIDFGVSTEETLNVFETTIRYLGGLLSAYDLSGERVLIEKAVEDGEMLYVAFRHPKPNARRSLGTGERPQREMRKLQAQGHW
jgi:mannosyl-oligosaccharide alpha-1,2-mannosidase